MDVKLLKEQIKVKNKQISEMRKFVRQSEHEIAKYLCPFEIGQRVISPKGNVEVVAHISHVSYGVGYEFKIYKIKENGEAYKNSQYAYRLGEYKPA